MLKKLSTVVLLGGLLLVGSVASANTISPILRDGGPVSCGVGCWDWTYVVLLGANSAIQNSTHGAASFMTIYDFGLATLTWSSAAPVGGTFVGMSLGAGVAHSSASDWSLTQSALGTSPLNYPSGTFGSDDPALNITATYLGSGVSNPGLFVFPKVLGYLHAQTSVGGPSAIDSFSSFDVQIANPHGTTANEGPVQVPAPPAPEPSTLLILGSGFLGVSLLRRIKK